MSEIVLSTTNYDDYSTNGSMMMDINPGLVHHHHQKSVNDHTSTSPTTSNFDSVVTSQHQQYSTYPAYAFQPMPMGYPPVPTTNYQPMSTRLGYYDNNERPQQPNSPESISSSSSTPSPPPTNSNVNHTLSYPAVATPNNELTTPLMTSSSSTSTTSSASSSNSASNKSSRFNNPTTARVKEMITRANSVPMEFYHTEFLEYSKETYEKKMESKRNKRKRPACAAKEQQQMTQQEQQLAASKKQKIFFAATQEEEEEGNSDDETNDDEENLDQSRMSSAEIRRQIHIQSEQKRRAQIKDGFDELRKHLPGCNNKKMSKAALLTRTVQQLQHLKGMQNELLSEVERLLQENEALKKFQHGVLQRQAMEKMYTF